VNQPSAAGPADADQVASIVLERIRAQLGPQAGRPMDAPPADQAVALRDQAPELYELWLRIARERAATANYVERAPYEVPERLAQAGRPRALGALIIVLAFCGYLAWLGGPGPYIAGLIALVDLGAMVGIFFGLSPERLSGLRRPDRSGRPRDRTGLARGQASHIPARPPACYSSLTPVHAVVGYWAGTARLPRRPASVRLGARQPPRDRLSAAAASLAKPARARC
jgi:hypothetical protein